MATKRTLTGNSAQSTATSETKTTMNTENETTTATDSTAPAWIIKTRDRAVKVYTPATAKDKKTTIIDGVKVALRNLPFPPREFYVPNLAECQRAIVSDPKAQEIILDLIEGALGSLAALGTATGADKTVYADLDSAKEGVSLTYTYAALPTDWASWAAIAPESGTRVSDVAIRTAQDRLIDGWLQSMYLAGDSGEPVDATGAPSKTLVYPPQALGWRASVETLRAACNPRASYTVAQLASLMKAPIFTGIKPGQSARLHTWAIEGELFALSTDDLPDTAGKADLRALDTWIDALALATAATAESTATVELDF